MRQKLLFSMALLLIFCLMSFIDYIPNERPYGKAQIESFIREVFGEHADELVFNDSTDRLALITGFLERFEIAHHPEYAGKKITLLSTVRLNNKYNASLGRDTAVNPETFNPLKYRFEMASRNVQLYRVDGTDFIIIIQPVK